jgi:hypothetical protein
VQALQKLLAENGIAPSAVAFIAHSTTQAANAMLEGDVVPVGILSAGEGLGNGAATGAGKMGWRPPPLMRSPSCTAAPAAPGGSRTVPSGMRIPGRLRVRWPWNSLQEI